MGIKTESGSHASLLAGYLTEAQLAEELNKHVRTPALARARHRPAIRAGRNDPEVPHSRRTRLVGGRRHCRAEANWKEAMSLTTILGFALRLRIADGGPGWGEL